MMFEARPKLLNLVEVRGIRRQKQDLAPRLCNQVLSALGFVKAGIIHAHDLARASVRNEELFDPGLK